MARYCEVTDGLVTNYSGIELPGFILGPDDALVGWHWDSVGGFRAPETEPYASWNPGTELWEYNPALFTVAMMDDIKQLRKDTVATHVITYVRPDTSTISLTGDDTTKSALHRIMSLALLHDDPNYTVDFKMPDDSFKTLSTSDIQGCFKDCGDFEQTCFTAERAVYDAHAITPFTTLSDAETAFNTAAGL